MSQSNIISKLKDMAGGKATRRHQALAEAVLKNPGRVVMLRSAELAAELGVSQSTLVRFIRELGLKGYREFRGLVRDFIDSGYGFLDRLELVQPGKAGESGPAKVVLEELDNLGGLLESLDEAALSKAAAMLAGADGSIMVLGSRMSFTVAYFLGWSLAKWDHRVSTLDASSSVCLDRLSLAPAGSICLVVATKRYPLALLRATEEAAELRHRLILLADGPSCPVQPLADAVLIAPSRHLPLVGSLSAMQCLAQCLLTRYVEVAGPGLKANQARLEELYRRKNLLHNP